VSVKKLRHGHGIGAHPLHPKRQRAHAAHQEPGLERADDRAGVVAIHRNRLPHRSPLIAAGQDPGQNIGVPVDRLARRMHHDIGAVIKRAHQNRRGGCGIHHQNRPRLMGKPGSGGDINHLEPGIGRRLDPDQIGRRATGLGQGGRGIVGRRHQRELEQLLYRDAFARRKPDGPSNTAGVL
jgi:hypothetical protein